MDQFDDTLNHDGDIPQKRGPGRPKGSKNKPRPEPKSVSAILATVPKGPREIAPSLGAPFEVYHTPDPLAMVQALYAEVAWRIQTLRNARKLAIAAALQKDKANDRVERGLQTDEAVVPILIDTANTLMKTLQSHEKALMLAEKLSKNKSPAELLELAIVKVMGQDLATQQAIVKRLREHISKLAPETAIDKVRTGESALSNLTAAEAFAALGIED